MAYPAAAAASQTEDSGRPGNDVDDDAFGGSLRVVLVEPQDGRNVGSVGRLAANFGVKDIIIVSKGQIEFSQHRLKRRQGLEDSPAGEEADDDGDEAVGGPDLFEEPLEGGQSAATLEDDAADLDGAAGPLEPSSFDLRYWKRAKPLATGDGLLALQRVRVVADVSAALEGCNAAVAFTGREGGNFRPPRVEHRDLQTLLPKLRRGQVAAPPGEPPAAEAGVHAGGSSSSSSNAVTACSALRLALVFGREDLGLRKEELLRCSHCCSIPTHDCSSLNLSQAVAVALCRLYEERVFEEPLESGRSDAAAALSGGSEAAEEELPAPLSEVESFMDRLKDLLEKIGYPVGRTYKERKEKFCFRLLKHICTISRVLYRARITAKELVSFKSVVDLLAGEEPKTKGLRKKRDCEEQSSQSPQAKAGEDGKGAASTEEGGTDAAEHADSAAG
eukprot:TRINITY_DN28781_c0_g1_i1.p1 TRINITY_DN28781_c0_g1~~TRINITY_DN28781_c0_g1_i1.p1  ORF type:complete len:446 (-),score=109.61 TRINITY_DN28781_c0_g1_i1:9-1346(-)